MKDSVRLLPRNKVSTAWSRSRNRRQEVLGLSRLVKRAFMAHKAVVVAIDIIEMLTDCLMDCPSPVLTGAQVLHIIHRVPFVLRL